eukprot:7819997-Pyramimonas_sp.AAC.1
MSTLRSSLLLQSSTVIRGLSKTFVGWASGALGEGPTGPAQNHAQGTAFIFVAKEIEIVASRIAHKAT